MTTREGEDAEVASAPKRRRIPMSAVKRCLATPGPSVEQLVEQAFMSDAVRLILNGLSPERHAVIALSFGLADRTGVNRGSYTLDEIARVLRISRERVAAVRATTLLRLRQRAEAVRRLAPFVHLLGEG